MIGATQQAFLRALSPPPTLKVSEWADQFRMLSPEASAEPGRWDTSRAPYQRAIMDAVNDPLVDTIVVMSSAQVGKTEILCNVVGYHIDLDPAPILFIQPTLEMAEAFSKDRIVPMLRDSPSLRSKVSLNSRDNSNTIRHKTFAGGHLTLAGSNSPAGLASRPIRIVLADEVDRWEVSDEGDPLALAKKRTTTFWNRKHLVVSTPTLKGFSRIEAKYEESDQRRCFVPCPHCEHRHVLEWKHVRWIDDNPYTAHLVCPHCGCEIDEGARAQMLKHPEWRATATFRGIAGFHIWEAYSPWRRLAEIVADFREAKKKPDTLQVWVNTSLGETWEEKGEQPPEDVLLARREPYDAQVPAGACCLTMSIDTQDDRLEALIIGWGVGEEAWIIEHHTLPGDPQRPEPWLAADELLTAGYTHASGVRLYIEATCVDTAGHRTNFAYDYVAKRQAQRVYGIIGRSGPNMPIVSAPSQKRTGRDARKFPLYTVGVDACKGLIHSRLKVTDAGPGYIHLPLPHQPPGAAFMPGLNEEHIAQLASEKLVVRHKSGVPVQVWQKTRTRNELFDLFVYGIAALRLRKPNLAEMAARLDPSNPKMPPPPSGRRVIRSDYINR